MGLSSLCVFSPVSLRTAAAPRREGGPSHSGTCRLSSSRTRADQEHRVAGHQLVLVVSGFEL